MGGSNSRLTELGTIFVQRPVFARNRARHRRGQLTLGSMPHGKLGPIYFGHADRGNLRARLRSFGQEHSAVLDVVDVDGRANEYPGFGTGVNPAVALRIVNQRGVGDRKST